MEENGEGKEKETAGENLGHDPNHSPHRTPFRSFVTQESAQSILKAFQREFTTYFVFRDITVQTYQSLLPLPIVISTERKKNKNFKEEKQETMKMKGREKK